MGRRTWCVLLSLLAAAWLGCHEPTAPIGYAARPNASLVPTTPTLIDLGTLDGTECDNFDIPAARAVNNRGQVVGDACTAAGERHAFLWEDGTMTDLGTLTGAAGYSNAHSINDAGQILGNSVAADNRWHTVLWQNGQIIDLDQGFSPSSGAILNERGQVAGNRWGWGTGEWNAFLWDGTTFIGIPRMIEVIAMNNHGQVVGWLVEDGLSQAAIWDPTTGITVIGLLEGWDVSRAYGVNDHGEVIGDAATFMPGGAEAIYYTWIWDAVAGLRTLPPLSLGARSFATDINDAGLVVGWGLAGAGQARAVMWQDGVLQQLGYLTASLPSSEAYHINERGQVTGWSRSGDSPNSLYETFLWQDGVMSALPSLGNGSRPYAMSDAGHIVGTSTMADGKTHPVLWVTMRQATAEEEVDLLIDYVTGLIDAGILNRGQGEALLTKLGNVQNWLADGKIKAAENVLEAFIDEVEAFVRARTLSPEDGQALIDGARSALAQLP